ncbi:hypothetical protein [Micromonospora robiginosa]|uniref:Glycosyl hydrolase family 26 n=1 Tax=Micromonospora robiginosa TaxID=2749844 RepID=A0A7L6B808_9ACTN|nr:hypothetical protein [Micromonospora ferruginea]QLQ38001.1 hypothetical protein H1D33_03660 [Micromonospora ferruginea]
MLAMYRDTGAGRIFVQPGKPMPTWDGSVLGPLVAAGVTVHVSYKTNPLAEVLAWAARKPAGSRLKLTKNHEPEQGPASGDPTPEEFHAAWAELWSAFDAAPMRDEIWLGPTYTRYWWQANPGDTRWMPRQPVDFVGWDVYNNGTTYRSPDDLLSIPRAVAEQLGVPYLVAELGAQRLPGDRDGAGQQAWMRAMVDAIKADGGLTCCWYHKEGWDLAAPGSEPARLTWQTIISEETPVATTAPKTLLDARQLLLDHLDMHPGKTVDDDLDPAEVGIVGDSAHRGGYHCGEDRVVSGDYSVVESARDRTGLDRWACALDVGQFEVTTSTGTYDLPHYSRWLVAQCEAGTDDTRDIREVIYSPDGKTVRRWDRLGRRSSGDITHLFHTHKSYFRDAIRAGRDQTAVIRRYLTTIGLIEGDDDMPTAAEIAKALLAEDLSYTGSGALPLRTLLRNLHQQQRGPAFADWQQTREAAALKAQVAAVATALAKLPALVGAEGTSPAELAAALAALPRPEPVDVGQLASAVAERVLAGLPPADGPVSRDDLEAALRTVLGSLDGAAPQA